LQQIEQEFAVEPVDLTSNNEVAKRYRYADDTAEFGLIASVTQPFCGGCTRARISADGKLYTCLFASEGMDLKAFMRSDDYSKADLLARLMKHWGARDDNYSEVRSMQQTTKSKIEMSYIGG
jgi:cyclic pyranopterin phosphate synthase